MQELTIKKDFKDLIHPLSQEEKTFLEKDILSKGCLDALKTWNGYLIDGHHRYEICQKHSVLFKHEELSFEDEEAVKLWMIDNQMGRRNITDAAKIQYSLLREEIDRDGARKRQACGQGGVLLSENFRRANEETGKVSAIVGKRAGVSDRTVEKFKCIQEKAPEEVVKALCEGTPIDGKKLSIDKVYRDVQRQEKKETLKTTEFPKGSYRVVYADPPWSYDNSRAEGQGDVKDQYPTMSLEDICNLPVKGITDANAVLFLWVTVPLIQQGLKVVEAWGFDYKTHMIWDKVRPFFGNYFAVGHEILLLGTKGSCTPDSQERPNSVLRVAKGRHSEKPKEARKLIETLYKYGNKVELFARKKTEGWDVYGNECG